MSAARRPVLARVAICLEAGAFLALATVLCAVLDSPRLTRRFGVATQPGARPPARPPGEAVRVGRVVGQVADVLPWHPTCLRQALAVRWMLRRRRIPSQCHMGVVRVAPFEAHAWVTVDETVVVGGPVHNATRLATFA